MNDPLQATVAARRTKPARPVREWIGLAIVAAGALVLASQFWQFVRADPVVWNALSAARWPRWPPRWARCRCCSRRSCPSGCRTRCSASAPA
jgi:hypothetical protein